MGKFLQQNFRECVSSYNIMMATVQNYAFEQELKWNRESKSGSLEQW